MGLSSENIFPKQYPQNEEQEEFCRYSGISHALAVDTQVPLSTALSMTDYRRSQRKLHSRFPGRANRRTLTRSLILRQRGIASIWVVLILLVLIGIVGMSIDTAFMVTVAQQLQIGADAAALAGAQEVRYDVPAARLAAVTVGFANTAGGAQIQLSSNDANAADGDIVVGRFDRDTGIFNPDSSSRNAVKVVARRTDSSLGGPLELFFGPAFDLDTANIERQAIAMIGGGTGSGLIALSSDAECALDIYGSVIVHVNGGSIQINSEDDCASCFQGNMLLDALEVNSVGDICITGGGPDLLPELNEDVDPIPDPLAELPEPVWDPADDLGTIAITGGDVVTISPGFYSGGISINNGSLTLEPGIYIVDGAGFNVTGSADLFAEGVMIFITGTGILDFSGTGVLHISPPDPDEYSYAGVDTYEYISIFQARDNTNPSRVIGTSLMDLEGTYYFPSNHIQLGGNAEKFGNQLIADTIEIFGNGEITINYEGHDAAAGGRVFLVS